MIRNIKGALPRVNALAVAATLIVAALVPVLSAQQTSALGLLDRSLQVTSTNPSDDALAPDGSTYTFGSGGGQVPAGDPRNGTKVGHTYEFNSQTATAISSITIQFCDNAFGYISTCTLPGGFSGAAATTFAVSGGTGGGAWTGTWNAGTKTVTLTGTAVTPGVGGNVSVKLTATESVYFVNPNKQYMTDSTWGTYFAHIKTFSDAGATTMLDEGTVTNSVTNSIKIMTRVQEVLKFSVGTTATDPDDSCLPLSGGGTTLQLGDPVNAALDATTAYAAHSFFRLSTNASSGVGVYYSGDTLKSSSHTLGSITASAGAPYSTASQEQFGLALDSDESVGGFGHNLTELVAEADYDTGNGTIDGTGTQAEFAFDTASVGTPVPLAVADDVVSCETGAVRYVANIANDTPAGIYQTKINYLVAPSY